MQKEQKQDKKESVREKKESGSGVQGCVNEFGFNANMIMKTIMIRFWWCVLVWRVMVGY